MSIASELLTQAFSIGSDVAGEVLHLPNGQQATVIGDVGSLLNPEASEAHDPREEIELHMLRPLPSSLTSSGQIRGTICGTSIIITSVNDNPVSHYVILKARKL